MLAGRRWQRWLSLCFATGTPTLLTAPTAAGSTPSDGGHAACCSDAASPQSNQRLWIKAFYSFLLFYMANALPTAERPASKDATPLATFRFENVSAALFTKEVTTQGGEKVDVFHVSLRASYRTADGEWKYTHSLNSRDLLPAALALMKCYDCVNDAKGIPDEKRG
jgi:hypothetical protein